MNESLAPQLKWKRVAATGGLVLLGTLLLISFAVAQPIIRIRSSSRPAGNSAAENETDKTNPNAVKPIDPTPEEAERIADLIEQLGSTRLVQRDRAMSELAAYDAKALGQVRDAENDDDDEIAARCSLLEEVIQSRQGELFLAARRLNLTINELNTYLSNEDVTPLLSILRTRAQAGLVALWARVFARLAGRPQLYPSAELCIEIEGTTGYGQAIAKAARTPEVSANARSLLLLMAFLPPGDPADAVEALTQLRYSIGGGNGMEQVLSSAVDYRGVWPAEACLAATCGRPDPTRKDPDDANEMRTALAICVTDTCTGEQLNAAGLPALKDMSPMLLSVWLSLLQRSGLNDHIESAMLGMLSSGADTRRISIAAGTFADVTPLDEVIDVFATLPFEAQLNVLDALWLRPREPKKLQPFLVKLLGAERVGIRVQAAKSLGQFYARSTAAALLETALDGGQVAPAALESLQGMADLLTAEDLKSLCDALPQANLLTRPPLVRILVEANQVEGLRPLLKEWRKVLPRNELPMAIQVLALQPETAVGAYAATRIPGSIRGYRDVEDYLLRILTQDSLEMTRSLLALDDEHGFALLRAIADDQNDDQRLTAMCALARAGRDGDLIGDWLKRLAGEIKDPLGSNIGAAIAYSTSDAAEEFKRNTLAQGVDAANLTWVVRSIMYDRCRTISRDELLNVLFDTPENAQKFMGSWELISRPMPAACARNVATALAFAQGQSMLSQPGIALMLADSGVDVLDVLYGDSEDPTPNDANQLYSTVLLGDPERAKAIVEKTEMQEGGANYVSLSIARAWLGLLPGGNSERLKQGVAADPTNIFGAVMRIRAAKAGDKAALRTLLDALGPDAIRFKRGATAEARMVEQRWGSPYMDTQGVADAAYLPRTSTPNLGVAQLQPLFQEPPADDWQDWWAARRALLEFDPAAGKYIFTELP